MLNVFAVTFSVSSTEELQDVLTMEKYVSKWYTYALVRRHCSIFYNTITVNVWSVVNKSKYTV